MDSNDEVKEIDMEKCSCYYLNSITKIAGFNLDDILIDEKSYEIILVYSI